MKDYVIALERKCSSFTFTAHQEAECPKADTVNVGNGSRAVVGGTDHECGMQDNE